MKTIKSIHQKSTGNQHGIGNVVRLVKTFMHMLHRHTSAGIEHEFSSGKELMYSSCHQELNGQEQKGGWKKPDWLIL